MFITNEAKMNHIPTTEPASHAVRHGHYEDPDDDDNLVNTVLSMPVSKDRIITRTPEEPFRLNVFDVTFLVVNRTIGKFYS